MNLEAFTTGGIIIDNMARWDGAVARDLVGGNAVYSALGAALWLDRVGLCGRIPSNYPRAARALLEACGLDNAGVATEAAGAPRSEWFFHRPDGSRVDHLHASSEEARAFGLRGERVEPDLIRRFEAHLASIGPQGGDFAAFRAAHPVTAAHVPAAWWRAKGVHLAPNPPEAQIALARRAREAGMVVTVDPGFHAGALDEAALDELLGLVDAFLPSEKEMSALRPGMGVEEGLRELAGRARGAVVVKRGSQGALVAWDRGRSRAAIGVHPTEAVDPTGAGDAFCGGYLAGSILGDDPAHAACKGAVSASFAVQRIGALPAAGTRAEALARLAALPAIIVPAITVPAIIVHDR